MSPPRRSRRWTRSGEAGLTRRSRRSGAGGVTRPAAGSYEPSSQRRSHPHRPAHRPSAGSSSAGSHAQPAERARGCSPRSRAAGDGARVGPPSPNKLRMPTQQRVRAYEERLPTRSPQKPAGRSQETRSPSSKRGRATWRRRTASSCRSTTISSSLNSPERRRSAATASARPNNRYTSDTNKRRLPPPGRERGPTLRARRHLRLPSIYQMDLRTPEALLDCSSELLPAFGAVEVTSDESGS
jgi:hypothetical protein